MTIVIVGIISIIVGPILIQGFNSFFASAGVTDMDAQGKLAMERMSREIRGINAPASDIVTMNANQFAFLLSPGNGVRYRLNGNQIDRTTYSVVFGFWVFPNVNLLATNVSALTFTYLQRDLVTPATGVANIWMIQIQFAFAYAGGGFAANKTFRTSVFLRNAT